MDSLNTQIKSFLTGNFMYNFSRVLPHAILSVILLDKGFSISQISLIQSIFMIAALIMEIPSGIISDIITEKTCINYR